MMHNRPLSFPEKVQRFMQQLAREGKPSDYRSACREMSRRSALVRRYKALARRAKDGRPTPVDPYKGPRLIMQRVDGNMTPQDVSNIGRQSAYLDNGRAAARSPQ